ncbi:MAG TPA: peptidylprolyl isomerase, partial [Ferruginibacter sp.]|nr:peptidylprolyl isomerase [Ferruginibacter sp.]
NYTVFGEVESGLDIIDKIASVPTAPGDRPLGDVRMYIEVIK